MTPLALVFKNIENQDKTKYDTFYSHLNNRNNYQWKRHWWCVSINLYTTIISNIQKSLEKGSGWIIDSPIDHTISISKYNLLGGSNYIELPKELDHPKKGLINIQNIDDNECFKWCLVRYLNSADHHPPRITAAGKDFAKKLDFKDTNFQLKLETFIKLKKRISSALVFFVMKIRKNMQFMYQKMFWIKTINYNHTLYRKKNIFAVIVNKLLV